MAEREVSPQGDVTANRPTADDVTLRETADDLVRKAPAPTTKGGKIYKVMYPTDRFVMAGMPVVDTAGVRLTAEQAKEILPAAEASGVQIVEVNS